MCGIVGYIGEKQAAPLLLEGLTALEYRGYDSAGLAIVEAKSCKVIKQVGRVQGLIDLAEKSKPKAALGIGHTRWATHGSPSLQNAHPHTNSDETVCVVHHGIIENFTELKA